MYDPKITARKAARAAGDTTTGAAVLLVPLGMLLALVWWYLDARGIAVPDQVRLVVTPENIVAVLCTVLASPVWAALGRAWRNWKAHKPRKAVR